mmetsp:Transcript_17929/g.24901  ORF Transcript_17929/g.24901 Transcript_17929/m.24901 type:complete len:449 (-) Transcript_17929:66-1412(-)
MSSLQSRKSTLSTSSNLSLSTLSTISTSSLSPLSSECSTINGFSHPPKLTYKAECEFRLSDCEKEAGKKAKKNRSFSFPKLFGPRKSSRPQKQMGSSTDNFPERGRFLVPFSFSLREEDHSLSLALVRGILACELNASDPLTTEKVDQFVFWIVAMDQQPDEMFLGALEREIEAAGDDLNVLMRETRPTVKIMKCLMAPYRSQVRRMAGKLCKFGETISPDQISLMKKSSSAELADVISPDGLKERLVRATRSLLRSKELPLPICVMIYRAVQKVENDNPDFRHEDVVKWACNALFFLRHVVPLFTVGGSPGMTFMGTFLMKMTCNSQVPQAPKDCLINEAIREGFHCFMSFAFDVYSRGQKCWKSGGEVTMLLDLGTIDGQWESEMEMFLLNYEPVLASHVPNFSDFLGHFVKLDPSPLMKPQGMKKEEDKESDDELQNCLARDKVE